MRTQAEKGRIFRERHVQPGFLILPSPWDAGIAKLLQSLGFEALATTSLGMSNALGRPDGENAVSRGELLDNCRVIAAATDLPVNADLENGYADEPKEAAAILRDAAEAGIVGGSIEDWSGERIYDFNHAADPSLGAAEMEAVGVKRLSVGGALSRLALAAFMRGAREMKEKGGFTWMNDTLPSKDLKAVFRQ
jgi:2-methylisocitrate lyase-like PEP mutase family enzyme